MGNKQPVNRRSKASIRASEKSTRERSIRAKSIRKNKRNCEFIDNDDVNSEKEG
eukprot:gene9032-18229_t